MGSDRGAGMRAPRGQRGTHPGTQGGARAAARAPARPQTLGPRRAGTAPEASPRPRPLLPAPPNSPSTPPPSSRPPPLLRGPAPFPSTPPSSLRPRPRPNPRPDSRPTARGPAPGSARRAPAPPGQGSTMRWRSSQKRAWEGPEAIDVLSGRLGRPARGARPGGGVGAGGSADGACVLAARGCFRACARRGAPFLPLRWSRHGARGESPPAAAAAGPALTPSPPARASVLPRSRLPPPVLFRPGPAPGAGPGLPPGPARQAPGVGLGGTGRRGRGGALPSPRCPRLAPPFPLPSPPTARPAPLASSLELGLAPSRRPGAGPSRFSFPPLAEEARSERWQKKEAGVEVHPGLHPPRGGWHHGRRQLCEWGASLPPRGQAGRPRCPTALLGGGAAGSASNSTWASMALAAPVAPVLLFCPSPRRSVKACTAGKRPADKGSLGGAGGHEMWLGLKHFVVEA